MAYSTKQRNLVPGTAVVAKAAPRGRLKNVALDILALPFVFAGPRRSTETAWGTVGLEYGFANWWWRTERALEIALAKHVLSGRHAEDLLEVGNVLRAAGLTGHTVVDKYETAPGVLNVDIVDFNPGRRYRILVSISTLEHVGFDEHPRDPEKARLALSKLGDLADQLFVTIPAGYNSDLEACFVDGPFDRVEVFVKTSRLARWERLPIESASSIEYGHPYAYGNGILVGSRGLPATDADSR